MLIAARGAAAAVLAVLALAVVPATPAAAHNQLWSASPDRNATLTAAPKQIVLRFLQPLDPEFTTIAVTDANQQPVPVGKPAVTGTKGTVTVSQPLPDGAYRVAYRVVSTDGHPVQGSYTFTVGAPVSSAPATRAPATPGPDPARSHVASAHAGDGPSTALLTVGAVVLLTLAAAVGLVLHRRRSRA